MCCIFYLVKIIIYLSALENVLILFLVKGIIYFSSQNKVIIFSILARPKRICILGVQSYSGRYLEYNVMVPTPIIVSMLETIGVWESICNKGFEVFCSTIPFLLLTIK